MTDRATRATATRITLYVSLGIGVAALLIASGDAVYRVQGGVADVAPLLPFGYAYAAGMVAAVNPCGVLFLPSLMAYYLGRGPANAQAWWQRSLSALTLGAIATAGFLVLFAAVGLVFGLGGRTLGAYFPLGGTMVGIGLAALGVWAIATDRSFGVAEASRAMELADISRGKSIFGFGIAYGVASLACTLPVFLAVVGTSLSAGGLIPALGQFLSYALGMGTMVTGALLAAVFFEQSLSRVLRRIAPHVHRVAAALLLAAGLYIIHYWIGTLTI